MNTLWITLPVLLSGWIIGARAIYRRIRPSKLPRACTTPHSCKDGKHYPSCYARIDMIDGTGEATVVAMFGGLFWPVLLPLLGVAWLVRYGNEPETVDELQARIADLEREAGISTD